MAFNLGSKDKQKKIVLTKEYLEARRGEDLKKFQDQVVALQQQVADLEEKKAQTLSDIQKATKDFEAWQEQRIKEISLEVEKVDAKKKEALEAIYEKQKILEKKIEEDEALKAKAENGNRQADEKLKQAEEILSDARKQKDEAAARWRKIQENIALNQNILNEAKDAEARAKKSIEDLEAKRHELIQIQGRIDAASEDLENQRSARDQQIKQLDERIAECNGILARVDKFNQDTKAFEVKQSEYEAWKKDKLKLEEDLETRKRQADIRDKVQEQKAAELLKREENVAKLEKGAIK